MNTHISGISRKYRVSELLFTRTRKKASTKILDIGIANTTHRRFLGNMTEVLLLNFANIKMGNQKIRCITVKVI